MSSRSQLSSLSSTLTILHCPDLGPNRSNKAKAYGLLQNPRSRRTNRVRRYSDYEIAQCGPHSSKEYTIQILDRLGFTNSHSVRTPLDLKLVIAPQEDECPHDTRKRYQEMGWIPYVARHSFLLIHHNRHWKRSIMYTVTSAARSTSHTMQTGVTNLKVQATVTGIDNNPVDKWSTAGYCYTSASAPMSWKSCKQNITATSSTEAEYTAQCAAVKEAIYLRQFLNELQRAIIRPTFINADNTGAMAWANDLVQHK